MARRSTRSSGNSPCVAALALRARCGLLSLSLASLASSRLLILQTYLCYAKAYGIARQDWEGKVVDRCNRIPEVAGWWVLCHKCPRVTDWVRVGYRSDQATTLFPIATSWRSFVGCPRRTGVQSLYGDKRTSVVKPQCFASWPFQSFSISICPQRVKLRRTQCEQMSSGLPQKADIAQHSRHVSKVPLHKVAALQPAARGQEPRDRKPADRKALAGLRAPS